MARDKGMNAFAAALVGAAVGAVAVVMSDRKTRAKVKSRVKTLMEEGDEKLEEVREKVDSAKVVGKKKLAKELERTSRKLKTGNGRATPPVRT